MFVSENHSEVIYIFKLNIYMFNIYPVHGETRPEILFSIS